VEIGTLRSTEKRGEAEKSVPVQGITEDHRKAVDIICRYAEETHCASELMGAQLWLKDRAEARYKEKIPVSSTSSLSKGDESLALPTLDKLGPLAFFVADVTKEGYLPPSFLMHLDEAVNFSGKDGEKAQKDKIQEVWKNKLKDFPKIPQITYSYVKFSENENLPIDKAVEDKAGAACVEQGAARMYTPKDDNDDDFINVVLDERVSQKLHEELGANEGAWSKEGVDLKHKLRLTALHEALHIVLREGWQENVNAWPKLDKETEEVLIRGLSQELLKRKRIRFKDFVEAEDKFERFENFDKPESRFEDEMKKKGSK
jgi:hypothetical protein